MYFALCALVVMPLLRNPHPASAQNSTVLSEVARHYHLTIVADNPLFPVKCTYGVIGGKEAKVNARVRYAALFAREFSLYPTQLILKSHLTHVVLCRELAFNGQRRNAIPDFEHDTLYLDVEHGIYNPLYMRRVIHHEFFHILDYRDDGSLYRDDKWAALNPPGFHYGSGGINAQKLAQTSVFTRAYPGFLNHYSTTGVEEDKAEVFAALLTTPGYVAERASENAVLKAKVARLKAILQAFCPSVNEAFWNAAGHQTN